MGTLLVGKGKMLEDKVKKYIKENHLIESGRNNCCRSFWWTRFYLHAYYIRKIAKELNFQMVVAHINHGIRESALADEEYVKKVCEQKENTIYIKKENIKDIAQKEKTGNRRSRKNGKVFFF